MTPEQKVATEMATWCRFKVPERDFREGVTEEQLIQCLDVIAQLGGGVWERSVDDFRNEFTRRATVRHTAQVETYAKKLDQQTTALIRLTQVLAVLTAGLFVLEVLRIFGAGS